MSNLSEFPKQPIIVSRQETEREERWRIETDGPDNQDRACWAGLALQALNENTRYAELKDKLSEMVADLSSESDEDLEDLVLDLLSYLKHFCQFKRLDFEELYARAMEDYEADLREARQEEE